MPAASLKLFLDSFVHLFLRTSWRLNFLLRTFLYDWLYLFFLFNFRCNHRLFLFLSWLWIFFKLVWSLLCFFSLGKAWFSYLLWLYRLNFFFYIFFSLDCLGIRNFLRWLLDESILFFFLLFPLIFYWCRHSFILRLVSLFCNLFWRFFIFNLLFLNFFFFQFFLIYFFLLRLCCIFSLDYELLLSRFIFYWFWILFFFKFHFLLIGSWLL